MATGVEKSVPVVNGKGTRDFSLRITNLPLGIEKEGAQSLFGDYGEVTGMMLLKGTNNTLQAFVSYSKFSEAENAIRELSGKPPLYLNVEFKDKNLRSQQITTDIDLSKPVPDFRYKTSSIQCTKVNMGKANCTPYMQPPNYTTDDELLYEVPTHPAIYNPYSNSGPYRETNLMFTRGMAYVSKDGRRHVAHGRGYTFYDLPEPHNDIGTYVQKELEKRENGYYEYATDDLEDEIANCKVCQTPTAFRCQKCTLAFYCGRTCQLNDWPKHKQECQPVPPLVKKVNKTSTQNGHGPVQNGHRPIVPVQKESEIESASQTTQELRRPKPQPIRSESQSSTAAPLKEQKSPVKQETKAQRTSPAASIKNGMVPRQSQENKNDLFKLSKPANFKAETTSFPSKQQQQKQTQPATRKTTVHSEDDIVFQSRTFIPKDKFIKVIVSMPLSENECWVQRVEDEQEIIELHTKLGKFAEKSKTVPPEENVKCIVKIDVFFRATIVSLQNNIAKVFYYDFGTWEEVELTEVWPINEFEEIPPFARKIRMVDDSDFVLNSTECGEILLVKAVGLTPDGVIIVQAQRVPSGKEQSVKVPVEQMASCSLKSDSSKLSDSENKVNEKLFSNIISKLKVGQTGLILTGNQLGENVCSATLVPENCLDDFSKLIDLLREQSLAYKSIYNPKAGEIVSALASDESWFRGLVISISPVVRVALLDESRVIAPIKCVPLPEDFKKISSMGLVVQFPKGIKVPQTEGFPFTITNLSNDTTATLSIKADTFETTATIKKWNPKSEQIGILVPQLNSGHQICITEFLSQNSIHVQSLESSENERRFKLQQEIAKYSLNRVPLHDVPVVGTIVLALFEADGKYYRAIVTKIEDEKALIKYIDYGNQEIIPFNKMFTLPEELKKHPTCVAEVSLKNVDKNVPLTEAATIYMQELIAGEVPLICTFDDNPLENGVQLKSTKTNEIVNAKLSDLLKPTWKKSKVEEDKTVYGLTDLPSLKLGDVGDAIQAVFLCYYPDVGIIFFGPNDFEAVAAIQEQMADQIAKYVEATPGHYIPRDNELCIAKYQTGFYRALCLESSASAKESRVFFIDYGNTDLVNHKDIRVITEDFLKHGAYGSSCNISPVVPPEKLNSKISQRISEILTPNDLYEIKIISDEEDGALNIDIPALRVVLMQEKLI